MNQPAIWRGALDQTLMVNRLVDMDWKFGGYVLRFLYFFLMIIQILSLETLSCDVIGHVTIRLAMCGLLYVVSLNHTVVERLHLNYFR